MLFDSAKWKPNKPIENRFGFIGKNLDEELEAFYDNADTNQAIRIQFGDM